MPKGSAEYDIDLVCRLPIAKESTTEAELKERVGQMLRAFMRWKQQHGERLHRQTATGAHRMGVGGLLTTSAAAGPRVRPHTFYGQHPHPRG